jgi:aminomethyltransferase
MLPKDKVPALWDALIEAGVTPAGLGARDTLRLEAGLALYGREMDEDTTPLEAGLGWTVAWDPAERDFIGRETLAKQREAGADRVLVGLLPEGRAVPREGQVVHTDAGEGVVTSGGFAPTLERPIALARVPAGSGNDCEIEIRKRRVPAQVVDYPFVRKGKPAV